MHSYYSPHWVVRSAGPPAEIAQAMRAAVASVDRQLPVRGIPQHGRRSLRRVLTSAAAGGSVGIARGARFTPCCGGYLRPGRPLRHGAHARIRRRLTLGASRWQTIGQAARPGILLTLIGAAIGYFLARSAGRLLAQCVARPGRRLDRIRGRNRDSRDRRRVGQSAAQPSDRAARSGHDASGQE